MSRTGRLVLSAVIALVLAPAASAASPTPTVTAGHYSSGLKGMGSESRNPVTGEVLIGDPGPEPAPRLIAHSPKDVTVTLDAPADSLIAALGGVAATVTQTDERTYRIDVPATQKFPTDLGLEIRSTDGDWVSRANWGLQLSDTPAPRFATARTPAVNPALLSYTEGMRTGPMLIADGFGLNAPTLLIDPGAAVTVTLTGPVNDFKAWSGNRQLAAVKVDDTTYTVTLPNDLALPARFGVSYDYSTETFYGTAAYTADLTDHVSHGDVFQGPRDGPATVSALKLRGRKLSVTVACATTCPGVVTLKTPKLRIARLTFAGPGRYTATISRPAQRHLKRHHTRKLRAVLTTRGQASKVSSLALG